MATRLPRFIVIKSQMYGNSSPYACYRANDSKSVVVGEESVFSTLVKIEVERTTTSSDKYVHLRFCGSNRYWQKSPDNNDVVAQSNKPVEDTTSPASTLFEPVMTDSDFHLIHVQTGWRVVADAETDFVFHVAPDAPANQGLLNFVDWDTLVHLPSHVAFKGYNDKYLQGVWAEGHQFLQFATEDPNDEIAGYRVDLLPDGHVRIYSVHFTRYWRYGNDWIWASTTDSTSNDINTLFWPVKIDNTTIAFRSAGNNKFCKSHSYDGFTNCLNAALPTIVKEARISVEELVMRRNIYNVTYRMEDARIFNETPYSAGTTTATNYSDQEAAISVSITYEDSKTYSFSRSTSVTAGVTATISTGVPLIEEASIEISFQVSAAFEWGTSETKTTSVTATGSVPVPPKSVASIRYVATMGTCDIPYSYTQQDQSSTDGGITETEHSDGIYTGVSCYNFNFVVVKTTPLNDPSLNLSLTAP